MSLSTLIEVGSHYQEIAAYLDSLSHPERIRDVGALKRRDQRKLWSLVEHSPPISLEFFVPEEHPPLEEVIHYGKNTLPILPKFRRFQKRFYRSPDDASFIGGFNESPARRLIGPGFFMTEVVEDPAWKERGHVVIDYNKVPTGQVPAHWPNVIPNSKGLQMFVYNKTLDFMRQVSQHVSIGAAYKGNTFLNNWFVLCREEIS